MPKNQFSITYKTDSGGKITLLLKKNPLPKRGGKFNLKKIKIKKIFLYQYLIYKEIYLEKIDRYKKHFSILLGKNVNRYIEI